MARRGTLPTVSPQTILRVRALVSNPGSRFDRTICVGPDKNQIEPELDCLAKSGAKAHHRRLYAYLIGLPLVNSQAE